MAEKFYTILTEVGLAKVANSQLTNEKINLAEIAVGDGNNNYHNPTSNQVTLVNEKWRGPIGLVGIDQNNDNWINIESAIPASAGGFFIREVGVFDDAGNLIAVGKYPETYKPTFEDGSTKDLYIRMIIEVSNATAVTLKVDPTVVIASRKYVDDKVAGMSGTVAEAVKDVVDGTITILPLETTNKTLAGAINEIKKSIDDHVGNHLRVELSGVAPSDPNEKTWWYEDLGESFDLSVGGGGIYIGNASLDGTEKVWFDSDE